MRIVVPTCLETPCTLKRKTKRTSPKNKIVAKTIENPKIPRQARIPAIDKKKPVIPLWKRPFDFVS